MTDPMEAAARQRYAQEHGGDPSGYDVLPEAHTLEECKQDWRDEARGIIQAYRTAHDDPDIAAIAGRLEKATRGPWQYRITSAGNYKCRVFAPNFAVATVHAGINQHDNGEFIAHAREDIPALLTRIRADAERIKRLEGALREIEKHGAGTEDDSLAALTMGEIAIAALHDQGEKRDATS